MSVLSFSRERKHELCRFALASEYSLRAANLTRGRSCRHGLRQRQYFTLFRLACDTAWKRAVIRTGVVVGRGQGSSPLLRDPPPRFVPACPPSPPFSFSTSFSSFLSSSSSYFSFSSASGSFNLLSLMLLCSVIAFDREALPQSRLPLRRSVPEERWAESLQNLYLFGLLVVREGSPAAAPS